MRKLVKTILGAVIGMGIGYFMALDDPSIIIMLAMAGIPSGWRIITRVGIIPLSLMGIVIHLILAVMVGWISLPIELFVSIKECIKQKA